MTPFCSSKTGHTANARHGVGDGDGLQGFARTERTVANTGHGVGDGDGLQEGAIPKRTFSNARHEVGDDKIFSTFIRKLLQV